MLWVGKEGGGENKVALWLFAIIKNIVKNPKNPPTASATTANLLKGDVFDDFVMLLEEGRLRS